MLYMAYKIRCAGTDIIVPSQTELKTNYLPLTGGTLTGALTLQNAVKEGSNIPLAGSSLNNGSNEITYIENLSLYPSFIGTATVNSTWYNIISCRHRNGSGDGNNHGMYFLAPLTTDGNLSWRQQRSGTWQTLKTILDSNNYSSYALPLSGGTLTGALYMQNNSAIWAKNTSGENCVLIYLSNSNNCNINYTGSGNTTLYCSGTGVVSVMRKSNATNGVLDLGYGYNSSYASVVRSYFSDNAVHDILVRSANGLNVSIGWAGATGYSSTLNLRGGSIQCNGSTSWTSDSNLKKDIVEFDDRYDDFFDSLKPTTYKYILGTSGRNHSGFVAQEVEEALEESGLTTQEFAGLVITPISEEYEEDEDGNRINIELSESNYLLNKDIHEQYNLAYTEFIALNTWQIQKLKKRVSKLEEQIQLLEEQIQLLVGGN